MTEQDSKMLVNTMLAVDHLAKAIECKCDDQHHPDMRHHVSQAKELLADADIDAIVIDKAGE